MEKKLTRPEIEKKLKNAIDYLNRQKRKRNKGVPIRITPEFWEEEIRRLRSLL